MGWLKAYDLRPGDLVTSSQNNETLFKFKFEYIEDDTAMFSLVSGNVDLLYVCGDDGYYPFLPISDFWLVERYEKISPQKIISTFNF
jgi:hypothetical protein